MFAIADPAAGPFTVADALHGAEVEIADFDIGGYAHVESREHEWAMNWKLVMDTFTEPYHIPWLHKDSIAPYYLFDRWIHDALRSRAALHRLPQVRPRTRSRSRTRTTGTSSPTPRCSTCWSPTRSSCTRSTTSSCGGFTPLAPDRTLLRTSVYSPPDATRHARYYVKNLDVLLGVTNTEDFPMQELVQRNLASGAMPELVYGKMEPALLSYHTAINERLAATTPIS